jgi:hypothetical protein
MLGPRPPPLSLRAMAALAALLPHPAPDSPALPLPLAPRRFLAGARRRDPRPAAPQGLCAGGWRLCTVATRAFQAPAAYDPVSMASGLRAVARAASARSVSQCPI